MRTTYAPELVLHTIDDRTLTALEDAATETFLWEREILISCGAAAFGSLPSVFSAACKAYSNTPIENSEYFSVSLMFAAIICAAVCGFLLLKKPNKIKDEAKRIRKRPYSTQHVKLPLPTGSISTDGPEDG